MGHDRKFIVQQLISFIPLLAGLTFVIPSVYTVATTNYIFGTPQIIGITLFCVSVLLFFISKKAYLVTYALTLGGGLTGVISFTYTLTTFNIFGLGFQPEFLLLIVIFLIFSWKSIDEFLDKLSENFK